ARRDLRREPDARALLGRARRDGDADRSRSRHRRGGRSGQDCDARGGRGRMSVDDVMGVMCVLAILGGIAFIPAWSFFLRGFFVVAPRQAHVLLYWGKYRRTIDAPGLHWVFPLGLDRRVLHTRDVVLQIPLTTVVEQHGNPIQVSAVAI